ncbi:MAG TPA: sel1 repeat family protein [Acidobacteria bacterium]|nr:sel1 repeat family protein [Acidobacteriota bacterium]
MKPLAAAFSCQPLLAVVKVDRFNQRLPTRCGRVPNRETPRRRSASGSSTATATACRRTTPKQRAGSDWAADQGVAEAQYTLGGIYREGRGVPQDYAEAVRWYRLAADQGYGEGQSDLGAMYFQGRGVVQDYVQSHMWRNLAALRQTGQDHELSVNARDALASLMTPAQVAEAQRLAREWDAAHPGSAVPFISQGLMRGGDVIEWINDGVEVTPVEEVTPEEIAELRERGEVAELLALAEQGNAFAQDNLGDM